MSKDIQAEFEIDEVELEKPTYSVIEEEGLPKIQITGFNDPEISDPEQIKALVDTNVALRQIMVLGDGRMNFNEVGAYVQGTIDRVNSLDIATADDKEIKGAQASLNKIDQSLNRSRIDLQKAWMVPFEERFTNPIKALQKKIDDAKSPIAKKLTDIQEAWLKNKKAEIEEIKVERFAKESDETDKFLRSCTWFDNPSWLNKSFAPTNNNKIIEDLDARTTSAVNDITALGLFNADNVHAQAMLNHYRENGSLSQALLLKAKLEKERLDYLKFEEDRRARLKAQADAEEASRIAREAEAKQRREDAQKAQQEAKVEPEKPIVIGTVEPPAFMHTEPEPSDWNDETDLDLPPVVEEEKRGPVRLVLTITRTEAALVLGYFKEHNITFRVEK